MVGLLAVVAVAGVAAYFVSNQKTTTSTSGSSSSSSPTLAIAIAISPAIPLVAPGQTQNYSSVQISSQTGGGAVGAP